MPNALECGMQVLLVGVPLAAGLSAYHLLAGHPQRETLMVVAAVASLPVSLGVFVGFGVALDRWRSRGPWPPCRGGCDRSYLARDGGLRLKCGNCQRRYELDGAAARELGREGFRDGPLARAERRPDGWSAWTAPDGPP